MALRVVCIVGAIFLAACSNKNGREFAGVYLDSSRAELEKAGFSCRPDNENTNCSRFDKNPTFLGYQIQSTTVLYKGASKNPSIVNIELPSEVTSGYPYGQTAALVAKMNATYSPEPDSDPPGRSLMKWWRDKSGAKLRLYVSPGISTVVLPNVTVGYINE
jgi:hypothetical protein